MPLTASLAAPGALADSWTDPTPEELAMQASRVEPGAEAEALLWEISVDDSPLGRPEDTVLDHYLRVKILGAAGVERYSTVAIRHTRKAGISHVEARTVSPDGTVSKLEGDAVFKTTDLKSSDEEQRSTTFALPNVTVGSIVEYRYRETRYDWAAHYVILPLQLEVPAAVVRLNIRPVPSTTYAMRYVALNCTVPPFRRMAGGFYTTTVTGVRAFVEEPFMPPRQQVLGSILVYYSAENPASAEAFWRGIGARLTGWFDEMGRCNREMKALVASLAGGEDTGETRLRALFDWCRQKIANRSNDELEGRPAAGTEKPNRDAADVFSHRSGAGADVNLLFGALAREAGFDVRLAMTANRSRRYFDPSLMVHVALDHPLIAVRMNGAWVLFDPGTRTAPFSALDWSHEGSSSLLCDGKDSRIVDTRLTPPELSLAVRTAHLRLDADGAIEGEVRTVLTGHLNARRRVREADRSVAERERDLVDRLRERLPTAEVTELHIAHDLPDTTLRYEEAMHLRVPDYATRVGRRLLLQPGLFEKGVEPLFKSGARRHPICFAHPWAEVDTIRIVIPDGYVVDAAEQPRPLRVPGVGEYVASARLSPDARELIYVRHFRFGEDGTICFPRSGYTDLKGVFDMLYERDGYTLTLRDPAEP